MKDLVQPKFTYDNSKDFPVDVSIKTPHIRFFNTKINSLDCFQKLHISFSPNTSDSLQYSIHELLFCYMDHTIYGIGAKQPGYFLIQDMLFDELINIFKSFLNRTDYDYCCPSRPNDELLASLDDVFSKIKRLQSRYAPQKKNTTIDEYGYIKAIASHIDLAKKAIDIGDYHQIRELLRLYKDWKKDDSRFMTAKQITIHLREEKDTSVADLKTMISKITERLHKMGIEPSEIPKTDLPLAMSPFFSFCHTRAPGENEISPSKHSKEHLKELAEKSSLYQSLNGQTHSTDLRRRSSLK